MTRGAATRAGLALALAFVVAAAGSIGCSRQEGTYPSREIRLIVHAAPGGLSDGVSRYLAKALQEELKVPVLCENRVGGGGAVAFSFVASSRPDGYTIGYAPVDLAITPHLGYSRIGPADVEPLAMHTRAACVLAVRADAPWTTLEAFVAAAQAKQRGINIATAGPGSLWQLASIEFARRIHTEFNYVPFPGSGPSVTALLGGHVDAVFAGVSEVRNQALAGNLRLLGVMAAERSRIFPDVPTFGERGYDLRFHAWGGLMLPNGTPADRRDRLAEAVLKVLKGEEFNRYCRDAGIEVVTMGPAEFTRFVTTEYAAFGPIVKAAEIGIGAR